MTRVRILPALLLPLGFMSAAAPAQDQAIPEGLPPGAKLKVIDIVFKVESFGGRVVDLQVKETQTEFRIELAADVLFDFDQATLLPKAEETLTQAATFIREKAPGVVRIEGHTDGKGDDAYNQRLSERRAESVRQWFAGHGLSDLQFSSKGFGE